MKSAEGLQGYDNTSHRLPEEDGLETKGSEAKAYTRRVFNLAS